MLSAVVYTPNDRPRVLASDRSATSACSAGVAALKPIASAVQKPDSGSSTNWPIQVISKVRLGTMALDRPLMNRPAATGGRRPTRSDNLPKRDCRKANTTAEG